MTERDSVPASGGLRHILLATMVAGAIGYAIQIFVPVLAPGTYLTFATMWSATYLVVTCLSGIQQEITRAARSDEGGSGFRTWIVFTLAAAVVATCAVAIIIGLLGPQLFPDDTASIVAAIAFAAFGYTVVTGVSGAVYGLKDWPAVAGMTVADSLIRAVAIAVALMSGASAALLGWATAIPFLIAAVAVWAWVGRRIRSRLVLDVGFRTLTRNSLITVLASLATGAMISGLPLILKGFASDAGPELLASVILVITLTRAPLVVPLVALQGYLIVNFRDRQTAASAAIFKWIGLVVAAVLALSAIAAAAGPPLMMWLYPSFVLLSPADFALIVLSAGMTGVLCVTGPAVLAAGRHAWYTAGWAISAIATVGILLLPFEAHIRILCALMIGPVVGVIVHLSAMRRSATSA